MYADLVWIPRVFYNWLQRFLPSEFGFDIERGQFLKPLKSMLAEKIKIREAVRRKAFPSPSSPPSSQPPTFFPSLGRWKSTGFHRLHSWRWKP
ncbi:hypothetical protein KSP40_PGU020090 [Platanthera guangdongensis]|uniref:Uncharacterized protein n=1 Tax=Platanthera guangdongensis TaxID=2320717 RepID=A0ABR2LSJ4_9ASPA